MKLHAHDRQVVAFNCLNHAVRRHSGHAETRREVFHRLVMRRVDHQVRRAQTTRQAGTSNDLDGMSALAAVHDRTRTLGGEVLPERAAEVDVDQLAAPADADDRQTPLHRLVEQHVLPGVAPQIDLLQARRRLRPVTARLDVLAAAEHQRVDGREHAGDDRPVGLRRQHERRVPRRRDGGGIGRLHGDRVRLRTHVGEANHERSRARPQAEARGKQGNQEFLHRAQPFFAAVSKPIFERSMSTISIGAFVRHAPRVKSGMSYARDRLSTDFSVSSQRQLVAARS